MKSLRLDSRGVAHHFVLALAIVGIISAFAFQAVAGHANTSSSIANPANCKTDRPIVHPGQKSACVAKLQQAIKVSVDGKFGTGTLAKVKSIQRANGINADGSVGKCTWNAIKGEPIPSSCKTKSSNSSNGTVRANDTNKPSPLVYCSYTTNSGTNIVNNERISLSTCKGHSGVGTANLQRQAFRTASIDLDFGRFNEKKIGIAAICVSVKRLTVSPRSTGVTFGSMTVSRALGSDLKFGPKSMQINGKGCRNVNTQTNGTNEALSVKTSISANPYTGITSAYLEAANGKRYKFNLGN